MKKSNIIFGFLTTALITSGICNILLFLNYPSYSIQEDNLDILTVGWYYGFDTLDPVDCWDRPSEDVIGQVVETLFSYDLYDLKLPRINLLAESYYWENLTILQIKLREGILFHDGTAFNASAVKWNLDRLQYLVNATGYNSDKVAHTYPLWMRSDDQTPIINDTLISGEYNISIILNGPYSTILNTLTHMTAGMISPSAHADKVMGFIEYNTEELVGTGPFKFVKYNLDEEVRLVRWNEYWSYVAYFKEIRFIIYDDDIEINNDLVGGNIDYINKHYYFPLPISDNFIVKQFSNDLNIPSLSYYYFGINNNKYNRTWRKAITYTINKSYIIKKYKDGDALESTGVISPAFGDLYNSSLDFSLPCDGNLTIARQIMVSMGFGNMSWDHNQWISVAESATPFLEIRYTYNVGSSIRDDLIIYAIERLKLIGIEVEEDGVTWSEFLTYLFQDKNHLGMFFMGWRPDFLEPMNILGPLFNPTAESNSAQVNDTHLNDLMCLAYETIDEENRTNIYKNIQSYIIRDGFFHIPLYHPKLYFVHSAALRNFPYNALEKFKAQAIWRI